MGGAELSVTFILLNDLYFECESFEMTLIERMYTIYTKRRCKIHTKRGLNESVGGQINKKV